MTTTTATASIKSNRRIGYEKRVANFISTHGPDFRHVGTDTVDVEGFDCDSCGKRNIHVLYFVANAQGVHFTVGTECQTYVLGIEKAELNAAFIRQLPRAQLEQLAMTLGIHDSISATMTNAEVAAATLKARRHLANKRAWVSRKAQKAEVQAAATPVIAESTELTSQSEI
jgi:uncharacterized sporulation protein YeaH/YhbH (DUF444 family)